MSSTVSTLVGNSTVCENLVSGTDNTIGAFQSENIMTAETDIAAETNYAAIKAKQKAVWESGDYCRLGQSLQIVGETLSEAMDVRAGQKVLDIAAATGIFRLPPRVAGRM